MSKLWPLAKSTNTSVTGTVNLTFVEDTLKQILGPDAKLESVTQYQLNDTFLSFPKVCIT